MKIDFVIPWVDGADPKWIEECAKIKENSNECWKQKR